MKVKLHRERYKLLHSIEDFLEGPMIFLGFVWLVLLFSEFVWGLNPTLEFVSLSIWGIFILHFLLTLFLAPEKVPFLKKSWLTIISLIIPALRVFRIFRAFRMIRSLRGIRLVRTISSLNRSLKSLKATMERRAFGYVMAVTVLVTLVGAAGMHALEKPNPGFESYGLALWWSAMRVITAGNEFNPLTTEGRVLGFLIAVFGYTIFGYVTASFATYFIGRDAEEKSAPIAGAGELSALRREIRELRKLLERK
jgi:voltage-gated potassium channel